MPKLKRPKGYNSYYISINNDMESMRKVSEEPPVLKPRQINEILTPKQWIFVIGTITLCLILVVVLR